LSDSQIYHPLTYIRQLISELNESNSNNDKIAVLKRHKHPSTLKMLMYIHNPYFKYNVSYNNILKNKDLTTDKNIDGDIFIMLDMLRTRKVTGHDAIKLINGYIKQYLNNDDTLIRPVLDKDLKAKISTSTINKVFPALIPTFDVALANKYEKHSNKIDWINDDWYWSRKLDGVRVIAKKEDGEVNFFSRAGKPFNTLNVIKEQLESIDKDNFVLDGEICLTDENGNEDFQSVIKEIRRKNYQIQNPELYVFDMLTLEEFNNKASVRTLIKRHEALKELNVQNVKILQMLKVKSENEVNELSASAIDNGWEGIMIRKDTGYKGKRSNDLLKVKKMHDAEYIVEEIEVGPFRILDKETGLEVTIETMTNVHITHKGNRVSVGSGFSLEQRKRYYENPSLIVGKEMTTQYFEETVNQRGEYSLRFPVCKFVFENGKRTV